MVRCMWCVALRRYSTTVYVVALSKPVLISSISSTFCTAQDVHSMSDDACPLLLSLGGSNLSARSSSHRGHGECGRDRIASVHITGWWHAQCTPRGRQVQTNFDEHVSSFTTHYSKLHKPPQRARVQAKH